MPRLLACCCVFHCMLATRPGSSCFPFTHTAGRTRLSWALCDMGVCCPADHSLLS